MEGKVQRWDINIMGCQLDSESCSEQLFSFIRIMDSSGKVITIDHRKKHDTFIENWLSGIINFHINRLDIEDPDNINASIWANEKPYDNPYIHTHLDHDDFEEIVLLKRTHSPFLSCITFFDDSYDIPFISTDITSEMCCNKDFNNINNKILNVEYPKILKHISFEGGKYYHGEGYTKYPILRAPRKKIVIALWKNKPHAEVFRLDNYVMDTVGKYYCISLKSYNNLINFSPEFDMEFIPYNKGVKIIKVTDTDVINYSFFMNLLIFKNKKSCVCLSKYIQEYINDYDSFIFDFSKLVMIKRTSMFNFNNDLNIHNIQNNIELVGKLKCDDLRQYKEVLLNLYSNKYSSIEKYVFELFAQFMDKLGIMFDKNSNSFNKDVWVSFYICETNTIINNSDNNIIPTITLHTNYSNNNTYKNIITNLSDIENTTKVSRNPICIVNNNSNILTSFDSKNIHRFSKGSLIVNIWDVEPIHLTLYNSKYNSEYNKDVSISISEIDNIEKHTCTEEILIYTVDNIFNKQIETNSFDDYLNTHDYLCIERYDGIINQNNISGLLQNKVYFDVDQVYECPDPFITRINKYPRDLTRYKDS